MTHAVILAGGKGTRLAARLNGLPKPLVDLCGMPLLERQILLCKAHGITDITILVNHAAEHIVRFCAEKQNWGLTVRCVDDGTPRGTAGAVIAIIDQLADTFFVFYGDTMLSVDLTRFWNFHHQHKPDATLFLHPNDHPHDSDLVVMDENNQISAFHPYPHAPGQWLSNLVNAGLYVVNKNALQRWRKQPAPMDFGKDLFPSMLKNGQILQGYNSPEYIKDCGTPERLDKVCAAFRSGVIERANLTHLQRAVFLDRDGTLNADPNGHIARPEEFDLLPKVGAAVRRLNQSEYRTAVITNQPAIARGLCSREDLLHIHSKMETLLGQEGAYLDRIYYCPHHPDKGFAEERVEFKIVCTCRKPALGMIEKAQNELNIDLSQSWLIGDTSTDMMTGHRAGIKTILVETGFSGRDNKYLASPDFILPDLYAATNFILDDYPGLYQSATQIASAIHPGHIVLIGGLSRSGKTTFARTLGHALRDQGQNYLVISLDRWIKSAEMRGETVLGRYDMDSLTNIASQLGNRTEALTLNLPHYDKWTRQNTPDLEKVTLSPETVVILEGTIAPGLSKHISSGYSTSIVTTVDESVRHNRFMREYALRGMTATEAEALYKARQHDEVPILQSLIDMMPTVLKISI